MVGLTATASYVPGRWVAVSAPGAWLLIALPPDHLVVRRCWELISGGAATEEILDVLVAGGIRAMPEFAFACLEGDRRALARGAATITMTDSAGAVELKVSAASGTVWADEPFAETVDLLLLAGGASIAAEVELPMASGVTMAASIRIQLSETPATEQPGPVAGADPPPRAAAEDPFSARAQKSPHSAGQLEIQAADEAARSYDFLFGATQRPPETEAVKQPIPTPAVPDPAETAGWSTAPPPDLDVALEADPRSPLAAASAVIDAVPWGLAPAAAPLQPAAIASQPTVTKDAGSPASTCDEDANGFTDGAAQTVDRAALLADLELAPRTGPTVLAGYCPAGHLSPPYATTCRVCRAVMPSDQHGFEIVRPPLGVVRLANGNTVTLDRGVLFGRAPEAAAAAEERPHLVRLVSPDNDVSRNHAENVIDGWHVYVKDLGSTNGTVVTLPGQPPVRLRPDDLQLLDPDSTITLADEIVVTFEVPE